MQWITEQLNKAIDLYTDNSKYYDLHDRLILNENARNDEYYQIIKQLNTQKERYLNLIEECDKHIDNAPHPEMWIKLKDKYTTLFHNVPKFGYLAINYRNKYPLLEGLKDELNERFEARYGRYRVVYNSYIEFNKQLQAIFDDVALTYECELKTLQMYERILNNETIELKDTTTTASTDKMYSYPDNADERDLLEQKHYNETSSTSGTIRTMLSNLMALNSMSKDTLKRYLDRFYILFETIEGDST